MEYLLNLAWVDSDSCNICDVFIIFKSLKKINVTIVLWHNVYNMMALKSREISFFSFGKNIILMR